MGSSSETLSSDGGVSGSSGCNIVYESSDPDKGTNKCFDSSDGGKNLNDNTSSVGGGSDKLLCDTEKLNVPEAKTIERNKQPTKKHITNENSKIGHAKGNESIRKNTNESSVEDVGKSSSIGNNGTKKKISALIAKFEVSETTTKTSKEDLETEPVSSNNSHKYPPVRNTRSATPEGKLSPLPAIKKRPSSSASCYQSESSQVQSEHEKDNLTRKEKSKERLNKKDPKGKHPKSIDKYSVEKPKEGLLEAVYDKEDDDSKRLSDKEGKTQEEDLPLGAEAIDPDTVVEEEDTEEMASTVRRNSGGYTSYVFIGSSDAQAHNTHDNDTSSVVSGAGSHRSQRSCGASSSTTSSNKIVVNVKDSGVGNTSGCVVLQDGRASNISIVSTESSEPDLPNSPEVTQDLTHPPPDLPAKIRGRNGGIISGDFVAREPGPMSPSWEMHQERSRGGDLNNEILEDEEEDFVDEADFTPDNPRSSRSSINNGHGNGLAGYFTSSIESPSASPSRRGRPPVIRAAERHNRLRQQSTGLND